MEMNKEYFEKELKNTLKMDDEKIKIISEILDDNNIIGKKSKEKIIVELKEKLKITEEESNEIYNVAMNIIKKGLKEKLKHPFKSLD